MPATRRRAAPANQATLSFGSKARITKPSSAPSSKSQKQKDLEPVTSALSRSPSLDNVSSSEKPEKAEVTELVVREQPKPEVKQPLSEVEERALTIPEKQLQAYWKSEEDKRRGPRVHQEDLGLYEKIRRHFDASSQFGPCIGINRIDRWKRADNLNLNPPIEILATLLKEDGSSKQRAYIDELIS